MKTNWTTVTGFLPMGFSSHQELQILHAFLFMVIYLLALVGNFTIVTITTLDKRLQSPMYFFLNQLSLLDISFVSVTVPQSINNSLTGNSYISYAQCVLQGFFYMSLAWAELSNLIVMSYDRYVAICFSLHYDFIMDPRNCKRAVIAVWVTGGIIGTLYTVATFSITFRKAKVIHQFFCDIPQLIKLCCSNDYLAVIGVAAFLSLVALACFISITFSYIHIFSTVLKIPSTEGRCKVFSTCLPNLLVVSFFLSTGICAYLKPTSDYSTALDLLLSIFYTVILPTLNPVSYSLRNETMKRAIQRLILDRKFTEKQMFCGAINDSPILCTRKFLSEEFLQHVVLLKSNRNSL
ncbi:olfactory receptor 14J1-like [Perognathus longimembris pacificus]|uniref:olfactory receptor 14J1-like n=1 Tax=Perognathus longimembris pacificus TaxID=214514 RepID=UPI002018E839|nr:olfactory receptor 14J1-like [Perognathus longimembris pacificus]